MPSTLRSASALAALWQCQQCNHTNNSTKNKRRCFLCRVWRDGVLRRGRATTASVTLYGSIWYYFKTPPSPSPPAHASSFVACYCRPPSATRHLPPVIRCLLSSRNVLPNLVDCCQRHRPLSLHCSPPHRLTRRIIRCPPSTQQHRRRHHCCNPLLTPTALVLLSVSHYPLLLCCLPATAIVAATPSSL